MYLRQLVELLVQSEELRLHCEDVFAGLGEVFLEHDDLPIRVWVR